MTPAAARRWLERRGADFEVRTATNGKKYCVVFGPASDTADASLVALVESLRLPRREPSGEWHKHDELPTWLARSRDAFLDVWKTSLFTGYCWEACYDGGVQIASGESRTLRGAQLAAERAARRARRLRGGAMKQKQAEVLAEALSAKVLAAVLEWGQAINEAESSTGEVKKTAELRARLCGQELLRLATGAARILRPVRTKP